MSRLLKKSRSRTSTFFFVETTPLSLTRHPPCGLLLQRSAGERTPCPESRRSRSAEPADAARRVWWRAEAPREPVRLICSHHTSLTAIVLHITTSFASPSSRAFAVRTQSASGQMRRDALAAWKACCSACLPCHTTSLPKTSTCRRVALKRRSLCTIGLVACRSRMRREYELGPIQVTDPTRVDRGSCSSWAHLEERTTRAASSSLNLNQPRPISATFSPVRKILVAWAHTSVVAATCCARQRSVAEPTPHSLAEAPASSCRSKVQSDSGLHREGWSLRSRSYHRKTLPGAPLLLIVRGHTRSLGFIG